MTGPPTWTGSSTRPGAGTIRRSRCTTMPSSKPRSAPSRTLFAATTTIPNGSTGWTAISCFRLAKFCLILAAGILIASWMAQTPIGKYLALIGKYSLFCFLAHRIILQAIKIPLELTFDLTPEGLFVLLLVGTLAILGTLCFFRTQNATFTNFLKKAYL